MIIVNFVRHDYGFVVIFLKYFKLEIHTEEFTGEMR